MKKGLIKRLSAIVLAVVVAVGLIPVMGYASDGAFGVVEAKTAEIISSGTCGTCTWELDDAGTLTISGGELDNWWYEKPPWSSKAVSIEKVDITDTVILNTGHKMFYNCRELDSLNLSNLDTSGATNMYAMFMDCTDITNLDVSHFGTSNVTDMGYMFRNCYKLTDLDVSHFDTSNVGSMSYMFSSCSRLTDLDVSHFDTSNVDSMRSMFSSCSSLTDLDVSHFDTSNVDSMSSMFEDCYYITDLDLSHFDTSNVTSMKFMFYGCHRLTDLDLSNFDTSNVIDMDRMFYECSDLKTLKLGDGWKYDSITEVRPYFPVAMKNNETGEEFSAYTEIPEGAAVYTSINGSGTEDPDPEEPGSLEYNAPLQKDSSFRFDTSLGAYTYLYYDYSYDESWFFNSSTEYQHDLARMSIRAAMAAFGSGDSAGPINIGYLMEDTISGDSLGFKNTVYHYPKPGYNTIGYAIGSKNIQNSKGETCSLLMVAVRGGGYKDEWAGNFDMGDSSIIDHDGFWYAAIQIKNGIEEYIEEYRDILDPNIKVWISGYSRGAATANLTAAMLDEGKVAAVKPENVYAYCFECPQNTTYAGNSSMYSNIFNIVNPIDPVPKVAMTDWGFKRYGITYYLPGAETSSHYNSLKRQMKALYSAFISNNESLLLDYWLFPPVLEGIGQASILDSLMNNLAEVAENRDNYYWNYQANLMDTMAAVCGDADFDAGAMITTVIDIFPKLSRKHPVNTTAVATMAIASLGPAHYPELCMFWLDSLDSDTVEYGSPKKKYWFNNCPTDARIYNQDNELVASFVNDEAEEIEDGIAAYIDDNGQKVAVLPSDGDYHFEITAREAGNMSYTLAEYDMDTNTYDSVTSFTRIALAKGDVYTGEVLSDDCVETPTLYKNETEELLPDIVETGDDVSTWNVSVRTVGNGTATGGGNFVSGAYSGHRAEADDGWSFDGWYKNDELLSKDAEYRFCVTEDTELTARFTKNKNSDTKPTIKINTSSVANPMTVKAKTVKLKYVKVKKKMQTIKVSKAFKVSNARGTVSYKLVSVTKKKYKKYFKISRTGKITVKKGLKKGKYKLKVAVTAAGDAKYKSATKTVTVQVKVK